MYGETNWSEIQRRENGERIESPAFTPGVDFDPDDPEDVENVKLASGRHGNETVEALRKENAQLRAQIAELTRDADDEHPCLDPQCEKCNPGSTRDYEFGGYEGFERPSYGM